MPTNRWNILKGCIPLNPRLLYFILFSCYASLFPFLGVIFTEQGLNTAQVGVINSVIPLVSFIATPTISYIYDYFKKSKIIWLTIIVLAASIMQTALLVNKFYQILLVVLFWSTFSCCVGPFADTAVLTILGPEGKQNYGKYRLWGAISWGLFAPIMGALNSHFSFYFGFGYYFFGLLAVTFYISLCKIQPASSTKAVLELELEKSESFTSNSEDFDESTKGEKERPRLDDVNESDAKTLFKILFKFRVMVFYFIMFSMGLVSRVIASFLPIYLTSLGASPFLVGLTLTFDVSTEIPILYFSSTFLRVFGVQWLLISGIVATAIRVIIYCFITNPWYVLPVELLHGLTFGATFAAGIHYSAGLYPSKLSATGQGIFNGFYSGAGPTIGSVIAGVLYDYDSPVVMFQICAAFLFGNLILLLLAEHKELSGFIAKNLQWIDSRFSRGKLSEANYSLVNGDSDNDSLPEII